MKIVILRHAETELNNSGKFCGRTDCNITENGKSITAKLANIEPFVSGFKAIYVSPLKRTIQTLKAIYPNCEYIVDERLIEISLGSWEGKNKKSVNQSFFQTKRPKFKKKQNLNKSFQKTNHSKYAFPKKREYVNYNQFNQKICRVCGESFFITKSGFNEEERCDKCKQKSAYL